MLFSLFSSRVTDESLGKQWVREGETSVWFSRTSWSLAYIALWRKHKSQSKNVVIWLPDYFCESALGQLRALGAQLVFYPITRDFTTDWSACAQLAMSTKPDIFILVHYFGSPAKGQDAVRFCRDHSAWLVEDAAHALAPIPGIGEIGDIVLYSPHKLLPVPDGAVMVLRETGPANLVLSEGRPDTKSLMTSMGSSRGPGTLNWLAKRLLQKLGVRRKRFSSTFAIGSEFDAGIPAGPQMSSLSRRLLPRLLGDFDGVAEARRQNSRDWDDMLKLLGYPTNISPPESGVCTYMHPCVSDDEESAERCYVHLLNAGIPASTWPDLPGEVLADRQGHAVALKLRKTRSYLPIHHNMSHMQMIRHGRKLRKEVFASSPCSLRARPIGHEEWAGHWRQCVHVNLVQSWEYGAAKEKAEGWRAYRLIVDGDDTGSGALVQVMTRNIPGLGAIARINRGPLFRSAAESADMRHVLATYQALMHYLERRKYRLIQIAPELPSGTPADTMLEILGFKKLPATPWGSALLDLGIGEDELLIQLKGKWRNGMRKGLKQGVEVHHMAVDAEQIDNLLKNYAEIQQAKSFSGMAGGLISALASQRGEDWQFNLFTGSLNNEAYDLGLLVTVNTAMTATYCIGTTTELGRKLQANSVLLWHAILQARSSGCRWFDVGGLNADTPSGIASFKRGLNAVPYTLTGEWRKWNLPLVP